MAYKVVDIYKDLPRKQGCSDCGKPGCFAFATAVHIEGASPKRCVHLEPEQLEHIQGKLAESRGGGAEPREAPEAQAAKLLRATLAKADLAELAERTAVTYDQGPPEQLLMELFGRQYQVRRDIIVASDGGDVDFWVEVVLMMYVTRGSGVEPSGRWVAYRDLPNTISKQTTFEKWINRLPRAYVGRFDELASQIESHGGVRTEDETAELAFRFQALPHVPLLLLLWDGDEDFEPRGSLLLDETVLDYLDQEALTFLAEELMRRIIDEGGDD